MGRPLVVDVFWSFRSPYSYLATPRLVRLAAEYLVDVRVRVVLPIAVRDPEFFARVNPLWPPYLHRLTRLGVEAARCGRGLPFVEQVSRIIWDGTVDGWHEGRHLADATKRAGLDMDALEAAVATDPTERDAEIRANEDALAAAGHWGVPTMVFEGEPFFGQDRIELLVWRLRQHGLTRR